MAENRFSKFATGGNRFQQYQAPVLSPEDIARREALLAKRDALDASIQDSTLGGMASGIGSALDDNVRLAANGISMGFLDKGLDAMRQPTITDLITGAPMTERAKTNAARDRQGLVGAGSEIAGSFAPMAAATGIVSAASKVPGMFQAGANLAAKVPGLPTTARLAAPTASGAAWGGATALGNDKPIGEGMAWGAGLGFLGDIAARGIKSGYSAFAGRPTPLPASALKEASDAGYSQMRDANLVFDPNAFSGAVDDASAVARERGVGGSLSSITDSLLPKASSTVEKMNALKGKVSPTLDDVEMLKRALSNQGFDADASATQNMAGVFKDLIDNAAPSDFISGNVDEGLSGIQTGRENWAKYLKTQRLEKVTEEAKNAVGANYTQAGLLTALRQKMRGIANAKDFKTSWTPEEQTLIKQVVRGRTGENIARMAGLFAPRGPVTGAVVGATTYANPLAGAAMAGAGYSGRAIATRLGSNRFADLQNLVQGGQGTPKLSPQTQENIRALIRAMIQGGTTAAVTQSQ